MTTTDDLLPEGLADNLPADSAMLGRAMRAALDAMDEHGYDRAVVNLENYIYKPQWIYLL